MAAPSTAILPGYKAICTTVGTSYVLLGASMVLQGARAAMTPFGLPETTLASRHFADFFHWVFTHMMVLGVMIVMLGRFVERGSYQQLVARIILLVELNYTYLDFRTSDSAVGNALYRGPRTLVPALIDVIVCLAFAYLSVRRLRVQES
jgi:hypothetical protein